MWWFDFCWLPVPHQATFSLPLLNRTGEENKMEKLMDWDKDNLIRKNKSCVQKQSKKKNLFTTSHWLSSWCRKRGMRTKIKSSAAWWAETQPRKRTGSKARNGNWKQGTCCIVGYGRKGSSLCTNMQLEVPWPTSSSTQDWDKTLLSYTTCCHFLGSSSVGMRFACWYYY